MEVDLAVLLVSTQDSNFHKNKAYFWLLWKNMLTFFYYEGKWTGLNSLPLIHNHYVGTKTVGFLDIPPNLESIRLRDLPCMKLLKAKCVVSGSFFYSFQMFSWSKHLVILTLQQYGMNFGSNNKHGHNTVKLSGIHGSIIR